MTVELIFIQGTNAGTAARIHHGYYLVGRRKDCQIRPKSRSVSRRHCLLLSNEDGFGALDLKSTAGTFVNGTRLMPHEWRVLSDGDEIRFGKVAFKVVIHEPAMAAVGDESNPSRSAVGDDRAEVVDGKNKKDPTPPGSWHNLDVAEFLVDQDANDSDDDDVDIAAFNAPSPSDTLLGGEVPDSGEELDSPVEVDIQPKKKPPKRQIDHSEYKRKPKRSIGLPSISFGTPEGMDWKVMGAVALLLFSISAIGYQVYSVTAPPAQEVRQGLD